LSELREQEFAARRFYHSERPSASIAEAQENAGETGTRSILDIEFVSESPQFQGVYPVPPHNLRQVFGTEQPTREMIERAYAGSEEFEDYFMELDRVQALYILAYHEGQPLEVFFAGWSAD